MSETEMTTEALDKIFKNGANAFRRLVERVLDGRILPFVGAGISQNALIPNDDFRPSVWWMVQQLRKKFTEIHSSLPSESIVRKTIESLEDREKARLAQNLTRLHGELS